MDFQTAKQYDDEYIIHSYGRFPVLLTKGKGATVQDDTGKTYIDFTSGIGVNALGFCDDNWVQAVSAQLQTLQHTSNLYYTEPCIQAAKLLCEKSGMKKVFFGNSGAEANEGVIKAARKYSFLKYGASRNKIIALQNSFHGRTMAALSATGQDAYHNFFFPFVDGFVPLDKEYVQAVAKACKEKDILLIVDEVQTGMGRTGSLFSYQQFGIQPDLVSCAKGLGGGLPIGAVLFGEKTETVFVPGDHGSTFGGNPVVCAGAVHILNTMDDAFLQDVQKKGTYLKEKIEKMPHVENVAGLGMMLGIQLDVEAKPVINALLEEGLLVLSAKTKIRLLPPLTITQEELDKGLTILEQTLASL